ncbi:MAG: hypothetical protein EBT65_06790, partial [Actinobacteria bacterium]|nr:hypothetical protein [Actinomycetota bacterium]
GGNLNLASNVPSTSTTSGSLQVVGGAGIQGNVNIGGNLSVAGTVSLPAGSIADSALSSNVVLLTGSQTITGQKTFNTAPGISSISNGGTLTLPTSTDTLVGLSTTDILSNKTIITPTLVGTTTGGNLNLASNVPSTSTTSGSLQVVGGAGIQGNLYIGGNINIIGSGNLFINGSSPVVSSQWTTGTGNIYYTGGNVGIGTSTPQYKLDISGSANISANVIVGNSIVFSDGSSMNSASTNGWVNTNIINSPPSIIFNNNYASSSTYSYISWTYPTQIPIGMLNIYVPFINGFTATWSGNISGSISNNNPIVTNGNTPTFMKYDPNTKVLSSTYITGIVLTTINSGIGLQSKTFPGEASPRNCYVVYDSRFSNLSNDISNNIITAYYTNYQSIHNNYH